jgi:Family of unknown function (DUF6221)
MTDTSSLRAFIEARLADDERTALAIKPELRGWQTAGGWPEHHPTKVVSGEVLIVDDDADMATEVMPHIARHDPARVLREVAAKRAILADLDRARAQAKQHPKDLATTGWMLGIMRALGYLALAWNDHLDFDPSWTSWSTA